MRKFLDEAKKKILSLGRRTNDAGSSRAMTVEEAARLTVQRYGDALRNLADK